MTYVHAPAEPDTSTAAGPFWRRQDVRALTWLVGAHLVAAVIVGLTWLVWSPKTIAFVLPTEGGGTVVLPEDSETQFAADGRFVVLVLIVAIVLGVATWRMRSIRGPIAIATLAAAALVGSLLASWLGSVLASGTTTGAARTVVHPPLSLHSVPILTLQAFVSVLIYLVFAGLTTDPNLGRPAPAPAFAMEPSSEPIR
jgi:hypothetical protein